MKLEHLRTLLLGFLGAASHAAWGQDIVAKNYDAPITRTPPTIDGQIDPGEWDDAPEEGNWGVLREPETKVNGHNDRFRAMWDEDFFYLLWESDYGGWVNDPNGAPAEGLPLDSPTANRGNFEAQDNFDIYVDPNTDGESPSYSGEGEAVDGYQINWWQYSGEGTLKNGTLVNTGFFLEAHVNGPWGNSGKWADPWLGEDTQIHQIMTADGGVCEVAIPWTAFSAPGLADVEDDPATPQNEGDTSVFHPMAPEKGDQWIINFSRITTDRSNFLPIWNWQSTNSFATGPYGTITWSGPNDTVRFGDVANGSKHTGQVTVENVSETQTVTITEITPLEGETGLFTVLSFPNQLGPGETGDIVVEFDPGDRAGDIRASFTIASDAQDDALVSVLYTRANVSNASGLVARYPFDETEGETAADTSGVGADAQLAGATLGQDGLAGGTSVRFSEDSGGRIDDSKKIPREDFSVSVWANVESVSAAGYGIVVSQGVAGDSLPGYALSIGADGAIAWFVSSVDAERPAFTTDPGVITLGDTHHFAVTYDLETKILKTFVDQVEVHSETTEITLESDAGFFFGSFAGALAMNGRIDDLQLYDRTLSPDEVAFLAANAGQALPNGDGEGDEALLVALDASGLALGTLSEWANEGGLGGSFTATGDPTVEGIERHGVTAKGVTLDGDDFLQGPNSTEALEGNGKPRSVEAWIYNPQLVAEEAIVAWGHRGGPDGTNFGFHSGNHADYGAVRHWGGPDIGWNQAHIAGEWQYLVSTLDADKQHKLYVNGVLANEEDLSGFDMATHPGQPITVGAENANAGGSEKAIFASLTVAKVRVHAAALSGDQIAGTFAAERGAFLPADEDGDGLSDDLERELFGDLSQGPDDDFDGDGLSNVDEIKRFGTLANASDSDGDGATDNDEITLGTDPNDANSVPTAPEIVVHLDASGLTEGAISTWTNTGGLSGDFQAFGDPMVEVIDGVLGVTLDGDGDYFEGPASTPEIEGSSPRSIIAWVYNPELASEETVISWGKRGGPVGTNIAFNHGFHNNFGAVGHWGGPDIGWNPDFQDEGQDPGTLGDAKQGEWTHISYSQTGSFTNVYTNGKLSNCELVNINTHGGLGILVGAQREADGVAVTGELKGSLSIANVRIFDGVLTGEEILADFQSGIPAGEETLDILFLGASDAPDAGADGNVAAFLEERFGPIRYMNSNSTDGSETADVIVMSSTFGSGTVRGKFHNSATPIVNWEEAVMDSSAEGEFGQSIATMTKSTNTVQMALGDHPIAGAMANSTIDFFTGAGPETLGSGELSAGTVAVGTAAGGSIDGMAMLFVTDTGGEVGAGAGVEGNVSPGRRVAFPLTDSTFDGLTDAGKELLVNAILWAAGMLEAEAEPIPGLLGYWQFDGDTTDASGNGHDGTLMNGAALADDTPGGAGQSLQVSGDQQHVLVPHSEGLDVTEAITIAAWVKPVGDVGWDGVIAKNPSDGSSDNQAGNYELRIDDSSRALHFLYQNGGADDTAFHPSGVATIEGGKWSHVAITAEKGGSVHYYIDGVLVDTHADAVRDTFGATNTNPLYIGSRADLFTAMDGFVDDVALFSRALSAEEIALVFEGKTLTGGTVDRQPADFVLGGLGFGATGGFTLSLPDGVTADIEYSTDLINWEVIAPGTMAAFEDTDAARIAAPAGFYRALQ